MSEKRAMIDKESKVSISRQCAMLQIHRSGLYYTPFSETEENLMLMRLIDEQYFNTPFYGVPRLTQWLNRKGYTVNKKRVRRLMKLVGWQTIYRRPNTSWKNKEHKAYPYLLRDLVINERNQVWAVDITYIPMQKGFMYLFAIIDLHTRYVINWSISNTMTAEWCRSVVAEAIAEYGKPQIINSDQGSQFSSHEYTSLFFKADGSSDPEMKISMDGKGRCIDNIFIERLWKSVKYECVYLHAYQDGIELYKGLEKYFYFYNNERLHQSLNYNTPAFAYSQAA